MTLTNQMAALRGSAGLSRRDHVVVLRVHGAGALTVLDHASTTALFVREGQMCHTLLLHENATPFADVYLCGSLEGFLVLAEGPSEDELVKYLEMVRDKYVSGANMTIERLSATHELWGIDGPYAWEVVATLLGPLVLGMPYLTMLERDPYRCFRAGKTGEFGYDLLVPQESVAAMKVRLAEIGAPLEMKDVSLEALDLCALENWHFSIRNVAEAVEKYSLTPLELQLQSRVGYDRTFFGADALRARRASGAAIRLTSFVASGEVTKGQSILLGEQIVGEVVKAAFSPSRNEWVGMALLATRIAHPHIMFEVQDGAETVKIRTSTPPLLNNRSLHVDPHRHSFRTRGADTFPPIVVS